MSNAPGAFDKRFADYCAYVLYLMAHKAHICSQSDISCYAHVAAENEENFLRPCDANSVKFFKQEIRLLRY